MMSKITKLMGNTAKYPTFIKVLEMHKTKKKMFSAIYNNKTNTLNQSQIRKLL